MLFTKKLVILVLISQFADANEEKWMTDQEALRPASRTGGNECAQNPDQTKKLIDELEKKYLCGLGKLTPSECNAMFLVGGAAAGGAVAAKTAAYLGAREVKPEEIICGDGKTSRIYELIFQKAYAKFCVLRSRSAIVNESERLSKILGEQSESKMDKYFKQFSTKTEAQVDKEVKSLAGKYKEYLKDALKNKEIDEARYKQIVTELDNRVVSGQISGTTSWITDTSKKSLKFAPVEFTELPDQLLAQRRAAIPAADSEKRNSRMQYLRDLMKNSNISDQTVKAELLEFKKAYPAFDAEGLLAERAEVRALISQRSVIEAHTNSYNRGMMSEAKYIEAVTQPDYAKYKNPAVAGPLSRMLELAKGSKLNFHDMHIITTQIGRSTKSLAMTVGKKAIAAPGSGAFELLTFSSYKCDDVIENEGANRNSFSSLGFNYLSLEGDKCEPVVEADDKFMQFFELHPMERLKLVRYNGRLCSMIQKLAEKDLMGNQVQIRCDGERNFTLLDPATTKGDKKLKEKFDHETAGLSASEKEDYAKLSRKTNLDHSISFNGGSLRVKYPNTTQALDSCKEFSYDLKTQESSEKRKNCSPLTGRLSASFYDYAQISKCCAGESNDYCDIYKKQFVDVKTESNTQGSGVGGTNRNTQ